MRVSEGAPWAAFDGPGVGVRGVGAEASKRRRFDPGSDPFKNKKSASYLPAVLSSDFVKIYPLLRKNLRIPSRESYVIVRK